MFRYWVRGTYSSGEVAIRFNKDTWSYTEADGTIVQNEASGIPIPIANPTTINTTYIDVSFLPTTRGQLDLESILDPDDEFAISGTGVVI